jgi:type I protein arginine methyltransferase
LDAKFQVRAHGGAPAPGAVYLCPSVGEYPIYDEAIYQVLREDERRNRLFRHAIDAVAPGATVLEIGCGPDLLWTLAAVDAGASRVYAIEVIDDSARRAERTARAHPADQILVIAGDSTQVVLPEPANVCIAEIVGCIGGSEGMAAVLADASRRHLAPSASIIPAAVRTLAGAVGLLDLMGGNVAMSAAFAPYVEAVFRQAGGPFDLRFYVGGVGPAALLSTTGAFEDLRFAEQSYAQGGELRLRITRSGRVDGLLAWIELAVGPDDAVLDSLADPVRAGGTARRERRRHPVAARHGPRHSRRHTPGVLLPRPPHPHRFRRNGRGLRRVEILGRAVPCDGGASKTVYAGSRPGRLARRDGSALPGCLPCGYPERVRQGARAGVVGMLVTVGLISLSDLAGQLLLGDPVTPQRLAALAVVVLAVIAAGCVAAGIRVDRAPAAIPVVRRVTALRDKSWRAGFLRLRDPDARGRSRPRAPSAAPAAA